MAKSRCPSSNHEFLWKMPELQYCSRRENSWRAHRELMENCGIDVITDMFSWSMWWFTCGPHSNHQPTHPSNRSGNVHTYDLLVPRMPWFSVRLTNQVDKCMHRPVCLSDRSDRTAQFVQSLVLLLVFQILLLDEQLKQTAVGVQPKIPRGTCTNMRRHTFNEGPCACRAADTATLKHASPASLPILASTSLTVRHTGSEREPSAHNDCHEVCTDPHGCQHDMCFEMLWVASQPTT